MSRTPFIQKMLALISLWLTCTTCLASETVFYALRYKTPDRMSPAAETLASLKKNYQKIDILIPQAYNIDPTGKVGGSIEPEILAVATKQHMKIMPLVTNSKFNKSLATQFLHDQKAQTKAITALLALCEQYHFYGIQLDFEMIRIEDRNALTRFYENVAQAFHQKGLPISFAVAPVVTDKAGTSTFLDRLYYNWEGAYDLKKIGAAADFVSIMAYNQHSTGTTPGPTARWDWTEQTIKYALQYIPANKISIGLPSYSTYWHTDPIKTGTAIHFRVRMSAIDFNETQVLLSKNQGSRLWDKNAKNYFSIFSHHWLNELLFIEDAKSFKEKFRLVNQYKLRGISVFDLGTEDPAIWNLLPSA